MGTRNSKSSSNTTDSSQSCDNIATTTTISNSSNNVANTNNYRAVEQNIAIGTAEQNACSVSVVVSATDNHQGGDSASVLNAQLSSCSSNSLTSVNSNCAKQIIIKIQYTKMENDQNEVLDHVSQEQQTQSEGGWDQLGHTLAVVESCSAEALESNTQFLNVNLSARELATSSRAAGSSTACNRSSSATYNRFWSHNTVDSVEYCEVLEEATAEPQSSTGAIPKKKERKSAQTAGSNSKYGFGARQAKQQGVIRSAINRWLEPSSFKTHKYKERKSGKHSKSNEQQAPRPPTAPVRTCHRNSMPIRQTSNNSHSNRPISIAGLPRTNGESNGSSNVDPPAALANNNHFLWAPMNASPRVVVIQPNITSVVTLGHIPDNIMRWMTTEMAGVTVGVADASTSQVVGGATTATRGPPVMSGPIVHSQVDFVHSLVPDLQKIFNTSYYWGKMDRYEAERLLEGKPEGTFLLRDSAQDEFLFSVTFRKYGRSLHARIEQSGRRFSFDCHDPGVFTALTVTGLLDHYKDPSCVMFFEPMLTIPLHRKTTFSLQDLCRSTIVSSTSYDGINDLELPARLKSYLKEYHYKQKLRVKPFEFYA